MSMVVTQCLVLLCITGRLVAVVITMAIEVMQYNSTYTQ